MLGLGPIEQPKPFTPSALPGVGEPKPFTPSGNPIWDEIQQAHSTLSPAAQRAVALSGVPQRAMDAEEPPVGAAPASSAPGDQAPQPFRPIAVPSNVRGLGNPVPAAAPSPNMSELNRVSAPPLPAEIPRIGAEGQFERMQANPLAHTKADTGRSGIGQIHNPVARHGLEVLDAIGSTFLPNFTSLIPGTELHHRGDVAQQEKLVTGESARAKADADAEESQARAHSLMNPPRSWRQSTEPEVDPENPDLGPQTAWYNESDPTQKHFGGAPVAARPVDKPPNEYADFKAGYAKAHPEATPDQVVSAFSTKSQKTTIEDQYSDAVADAFDRGADPSKDPKVAQLAAAIQERMRTPAPKVPAKDDKYIEIMSKPAEQRTPEELAYAKGYDKWVDKTKVQPGVTRMEVLATTRPVAMLDTKNGNSPVTINVDELNRAFREEPGRYVTGGAGAAALKPTALLEDIRGGIQQVRTSLQSLPPFSLTDRAKIALALRSRDPRGTINALVSGGAADSLTDAQQNYLINTLNLIENIMAMRSTLGAGQGSDDMRAAITATIPGPQTPSRDFGLKQLDVAEKTLDRLARGIPNVKLKGDDPQAATEAQKPVVQHSPSTGAYRYSTDGGKTWLPGQPPK